MSELKTAAALASEVTALLNFQRLNLRYGPIPDLPQKKST